MIAGPRNRRVTLERVSETNSDGEVVETWTELGKRWAGRMAAGVAEKYTADREVGSIDAVYLLPYDPVTSALVPKDRLLEGGHTYDIVGADDPDGTYREIVVTVRRVDV